ncbi:hypothetical protein ElyMa_003600000 [Elysia marginata]|uniref:Uncharacterized protein n=1 Tax=Elysia marginata TaxID=1093978 RepID=A0AAV4ER47_9GAST|nr:hypothetical protein ElyMa_003600000 [Elysia marginata]
MIETGQSFLVKVSREQAEYIDSGNCIKGKKKKKKKKKRRRRRRRRRKKEVEDQKKEEQRVMWLWLRHVDSHPLVLLFYQDLSGITKQVIYQERSMYYTHPDLIDGEKKAVPLKSFVGVGDFLLLMGVCWFPLSKQCLAIRIEYMDSVYVIKMDDHRWSEKDMKDVVKKMLYDDKTLKMLHSFRNS